MSMLMIHEAFARGRADVLAAAERLADDRDRVDRRVSGFLGSGWTGAAADAFDAAWQDWLTAATEVRRGLDAMGELLDVVQRDFVGRDTRSQAALDSISARLVARLG